MNPPTLIYDGHCAFCRRLAYHLAEGSGGRVKLESFHEPGVLERYRLSREACEEAMQWVRPDGSVAAGAEAAAEALRLNPKLAAIGRLYYLPGLSQLANAGYRWIARNRYRFGGRCDDAACRHH